MNRTKYYVMLLLTVATLKPNAVTYNFSGGLFGDNLLAYSHARWVSYKYNLPLLYRPFKYSDQLELHLLHPFFEFEKEEEWKNVISFKDMKGKHNNIPIRKNHDDIIYMIPYFPDCKSDIRGRFHFDIDWHDPEFVAILRKEIASLQPLSIIETPNDRLLVAVHVRTGAGHDKIFQIRSDESIAQETSANSTHLKQKEKVKNQAKVKGNMRVVGKSKFADKRFPLKFPPNSFYIEQIKRMSELVDNQPMYVHIFTDSADPETIANLFREHVNNPNIEFGCRSKGNHHNANVLDDFFALTKFDYLIRGESNFSIMAEKIADYKIVIYPTDCVWHRKSLKITEIQTIIKADREKAPSYAKIPEETSSYFTAKNIGIASLAGLGLYLGINKLLG